MNTYSIISFFILEKYKGAFITEHPLNGHTLTYPLNKCAGMCTDSLPSQLLTFPEIKGLPFQSEVVFI